MASSSGYFPLDFGIAPLFDHFLVKAVFVVVVVDLSFWKGCLRFVLPLDWQARIASYCFKDVGRYR